MKETKSSKELLNPKNEKEEQEGFTYDPNTESNWISSIFFYWCIYLLRICYGKKITLEHLGKLSTINKAENYSQIISYYWDKKGYKNKKDNALLKTILRANLWKILIIMFLCIMSLITEYYMILFQKEIIDIF